VSKKPTVTPTPTAGLRQRKKDRVRDHLVDAALAAFFARGFDATTIDDIVEPVEVSRRTFFRYFDSKEGVVLAWVDRMCGDIQDGLDTGPPAEPYFAALERAICEALAPYERDRTHYLALERLIAGTPSIRAAKRDKLHLLVDDLTKILARRIGKSPERELLPHLVANVSIAIIEAAVTAWMARQGKTSLTKLVAQGFGLVTIR
jgi:AcrR family transcriptional regulator